MLKIIANVLVAVMVLIASAPSASAQEYFGQFRDELTGRFVQVDGEPRFELTAPFSFIDPNGLAWEVPIGEVTDGASIPSMFWWLLGHPLGGNYLWAAVVHDHFCVARTRTAHDTHQSFYYGMRALGVEGWKASAMHGRSQPLAHSGFWKSALCRNSNAGSKMA